MTDEKMRLWFCPYCKREIDAHDDTGCLDAWLAKSVFDCNVISKQVRHYDEPEYTIFLCGCDNKKHADGMSERILQYSSYWHPCKKYVISKLCKRGGINIHFHENRMVTAYIRGHRDEIAGADNEVLAVSRAAIKACCEPSQIVPAPKDKDD